MTKDEIRTAQQQLLKLSYKLPRFGADGSLGAETTAAVTAFQRDHVLPITGKLDERTLKTLALLTATPEAPASSGRIPKEWLVPAPMKGIVFHWSAGAHKASGLDKSHYHVISQGDASLVRGRPISDNIPPLINGRYAAHTKGHNSYIIGYSLACMLGAQESPFKAGSAPMTREQWAALPGDLAQLCRAYKIPVTRKTVLSHAEVQRTLGIKQNGKWDITWHPGLQKPVDAIALGDEVRAAVAKLV